MQLVVLKITVLVIFLTAVARFVSLPEEFGAFPTISTIVGSNSFEFILLLSLALTSMMYMTHWLSWLRKHLWELHYYRTTEQDALEDRLEELETRYCRVVRVVDRAEPRRRLNAKCLKERIDEVKSWIERDALTSRYNCWPCLTCDGCTRDRLFRVFFSIMWLAATLMCVSMMGLAIFGAREEAEVSTMLHNAFTVLTMVGSLTHSFALVVCITVLYQWRPFRSDRFSLFVYFTLARLVVAAILAVAFGALFLLIEKLGSGASISLKRSCVLVEAAFFMIGGFIDFSEILRYPFGGDPKARERRKTSRREKRSELKRSQSFRTLAAVRSSFLRDLLDQDTATGGVVSRVWRMSIDFDLDEDGDEDQSSPEEAD